MPGRHTLRFTARLTFADATLGVETRELPAVVYGIYDSDAAEGFEVRSFIDAAREANARELDPLLPPVAFGRWLQSVAKAAPNADFEPAHEHSWEAHYCDERLAVERNQSAAHSPVGDLCTVAVLAVADGHNGIGRIWIRTGRIERAGEGFSWTAVPASLEAIELRSADLTTLSGLPALLALPVPAWPSPDISMVPEDIHVVREGDAVHVRAFVRNGGTAAAREAQIHVTASVEGVKRASRTFLCTVPANGEVEVAESLALAAPYGEIVVHVLQISDHTAVAQWAPDPTPDDGLAFRVVGREHAPAGYADKLLKQCGACRGF